MRGDLSIFIFIIVAVVLAAAILVVGMGGISQVGGGLDEILGLGEQVKSESTPKDLKSICQNWITSGSLQYDPEHIYNLQVGEAFRPYPRFWEGCGNPLNALVTVCKSSSEDCPNGVLDRYAVARGRDIGRVTGNEVVSCCTQACDKAIQLFDRCRLTTNTDAEQADCFNEAMETEILRCT
jgi:hypothetical protein